MDFVESKSMLRMDIEVLCRDHIEEVIGAHSDASALYLESGFPERLSGIWEFPQIRGPNIDPTQDPEFIETAYAPD